MIAERHLLHWDSVEDIKAIQNPALGSVLVWQFCLGYLDKSQQVPNFLHPFIVLPILWNTVSFEALASTRKDSGLAALAAKLVNSASEASTELSAILPKSGVENLYAIHGRAVRFRSLTFKSILVGVDMGLVTVNSEQATLTPRDIVIPVKTLNPIKRLVQNSYKLGLMCGGKTPSTIGKILQVQY